MRSLKWRHRFFLLWCLAALLSMLPSAEATRQSHRLQDRNFGTPERDEPLEERAHGQPEESPARNTPGLYARHHNRLRVQSMRARRQLPFQQAAAAHIAAAEAAAIASGGEGNGGGATSAGRTHGGGEGGRKGTHGGAEGGSAGCHGRRQGGQSGGSRGQAG